MVDRDVFERRLARIELLLRDLRALARIERERFLADLAAQCALSLESDAAALSRALEAEG